MDAACVLFSYIKFICHIHYFFKSCAQCIVSVAVFSLFAWQHMGETPTGGRNVLFVKYQLILCCVFIKTVLRRMSAVLIME